jgi:hypothetical protein
VSRNEWQGILCMRMAQRDISSNQSIALQQPIPIPPHPLPLVLSH